MNENSFYHELEESNKIAFARLHGYIFNYMRLANFC